MRIQWRRFGAFCVLLLAFSVPGSASEAVDRLDRFLNGLDTLQADFVQTVTGAEQGTTQARGVFYLRRPDRFRWEYNAPEPQSIIADGRQIWLYDPELEQVSVQNQDRALRGTPAMLLIDRGSVGESFDVTERPSVDGLAWFELIPRSEESQYQRIRLGLRDGQINRLEMEDKLGQRVSFQFLAVRSGGVLDDGLFEFEPPSGADLYIQ